MFSKYAHWGLAGLGILVVSGLVFPYVMTRIHQKQLEAEVLAVLRETNRTAQWKAFDSLKENRGEEVLRVLAGMLNDPEATIRHGAVRLVSLKGAPPDVVDAFVSNLRTNPDKGVRLGCVIKLMAVKEPTVDAAFLNALHDPSDKVVQIACTEIGYRKVKGAKEALTSVLDNPSWDIRLSACKALILSKNADHKTVETLEHMVTEKEAIRYDAQIEEFDKMEREAGVEHKEGEEWGKIGTILEQARKVAKDNAPD